MTELLAPAGNVEALDAALGEGADAVYMGLKSFNARLRSSNFAWNQAEAAVQTVHRLGKKIYITVNTVCEEHETERLYRFLGYLNKIKPDGLIVQDFGVIRMCQEFFPDLELHASTQMNVASASAANLLFKQGVKRVVVARELGLQEVKEIKENSKAQIEMFVHGALCVSESGLCLFSSFLGGKSANRGMCAQACRRLYSAHLSGGDAQGYYFSPCDLQLIDRIPELMTIGIDSFKIEGRMKSAEYVGAVTAAYRFVMDHWQNDKKGAIAEGHRILSTDFARSKTDYWYGFDNVEDGVKNAGAKILNPNQAGGTGIYLGKISRLRDASLQEIKEASYYLKKPFYSDFSSNVQETVGFSDEDGTSAGESGAGSSASGLSAALGAGSSAMQESSANRASSALGEKFSAGTRASSVFAATSTGGLPSSALAPASSAGHSSSASSAQSSVDDKIKKIQMAVISGGDYDPDPGDSIRLHKKDDSGRESHKVRLVKLDGKGNRWIDVPKGFSVGDSIYLLQTKAMSKRYKRVLPSDLSRFTKQPGPERLPILDLTSVKKDELKWLSEGLYIAVSTVADAHIVQALHPVRIILEWNFETKYALLKKDSPEKPVLPFSKKILIINLDPFVPQGTEENLKQELNLLIEKGYTNFIVNNLTHIEILKEHKNLHLIAGPYLYTFNKWAVSFLENLNLLGIWAPAENSSDNLDETFTNSNERSRVLLSVFSYPTLFRMRFSLPDDYDFTYFTDKENTLFRVNSSVDGSFVMPELPFSIIEKMDALKNKGFKRLVIDFTKTKVRKSDMRDLSNIISRHERIEDASRFNWKDGFYNLEKIEAYQAMNAKKTKAQEYGTVYKKDSKRNDKNLGKSNGKQNMQSKTSKTSKKRR